MRKVAGAVSLIISLGLWSFSMQRSGGSQPPPIETVLSNQIAAYDSTKTSMLDQLTELAAATHMAMGIEVSYEADAKPLPEIHVKGVTVTGILQQILQGNSKYSWEANHNVVHIFDSSIVHDKRNYLNLRIPTYRVVDEELLGASALLRLSGSSAESVGKKKRE